MASSTRTTSSPRVIHDMAFTENYAILPDFPMFLNAQGKIAMHWDMPSRFGLVPRDGGLGEVRWFDAKPTFVQHWLNAYEEGDEIILDGYFQEDPLPEDLPKDHPAEVAQSFAIVHAGSIKPKLYRWRFNLVTGETHEKCIDDRDRRNLEFGVFNQRYAGRKYRYAYSTIMEPDICLMSGWVKHDLQTGESSEFKLPADVYCSESPFASKIGTKAEDDGYLLSFIIDENRQASECWIFNANCIQHGPVTRIALPHKIKSGFHATWASREQLDV
jgi:carotenoid cleavage dioxygenase-like enzyme